MTNLSPTIGKILRKFDKTFGTFITINATYGSEADEFHKGAPVKFDEIKAFFTDKLQEVERETIKEIGRSIVFIPTAKIYTGFYGEAYEDGFIMARDQIKKLLLSHLKSGEEKSLCPAGIHTDDTNCECSG